MSKRDDILFTALRLFNQHGYQAVGVDRIRDEAQVSKMTLYKHFSNKEQLVEEVLKLRHHMFKESLEKAISKSDNPLEKLRSTLNWHVQWFFSKDFHGCMFIKATSEFHEAQGFLTVSKDHKDWITNLLYQILKEAKVEQPESRAHLFQMAIDGMIVNASIFNSFERIESAWDELCGSCNLPRLALDNPKN
ncbi:TetR/AcrR family transcriptional regulator [Halomonas salifodinae]|uniref:TetR/AcrR family transcriptional regulator n=1 Tax=Halomonas salifodinae TaxID=438745 RepID=A0ABW2F001_9GAMM